MKSFARCAQSLVAGLFILGLLGCGQEARIQVSIAERPDTTRDFERAVISLSAIELLREDDSASVFLGETRLVELVEPSGVEVEPPRSEIPRPRGPSLSLLKSVEVPAGPYRALRLAIAGGFITVVQVNGVTKTYASEAYDALPANILVTGELIVPEEAASGIEVVLPGDATLGTQSLDILLHFDVVRSFSQDMTGVNRWVMHPHVTVETVGELRGEVASGQ